MEYIRRGNDIEIKWAIYAGSGINEMPYDLTGKNLTLYLRTQYGKTEIKKFFVSNHVVYFTIWGKDQSKIGVYSLELVENEGLEGMHTVDECDAFKLVNHSCETGGESEGRVECVHLQFRANIGVSFPTIGIDIDEALSLTSENPVQNKVLTLALQEENLRAIKEETRLELLIEENKERLVVVEVSLEEMATQIKEANDKVEQMEATFETIDFESLSLVVSDVKDIQEEIKRINDTIEENSEAIEVLNADVSVDGSVYNKINKAAEWAAL